MALNGNPEIENDKWLMTENDCAPAPSKKFLKKSWQSIRKPQRWCRIFAIELKRQTLYGENRPFSPSRAKLWDSIARTHHAEWADSTRQSGQFGTSNYITRHELTNWAKLTNQNHETNTNLSNWTNLFCRWQSYRLLCMQRLIFFEALWKLAFKMLPNNSNSSST